MGVQAQYRDCLYIDHRHALIDYASRILGCRETAEDIVQEAYLRFAPRVTDDPTHGQGLGYLYRIVRNLAFDVIKRKKIENRGHSQDPPFWIFPQPVETPEQTAMLSDQAKLAACVLTALPEDTQIAVEMYRFGGHTLEAVAKHLGVSTATVHRHVRTAMVAIALALDEKDG